MVTREDSVLISEPIGTVGSLYACPEDATHLIILGHGAGAGMHHTFMNGLSVALNERQLATLRYQFPYMEQGRRRPDFPAVAHLCIEKIIDYASGLSSLPLVLSGKSFGGRMASQMVAKKQLTTIQALIFYGFPLHSPAKPGVERADHLFDIKIPMLFLSGDRDNLAKMELLEPLLGKLPLATLECCNGADHSFKFLKSAGINAEQSYELLAEKSRSFLNGM